jgi:hypothetical protein
LGGRATLEVIPTLRTACLPVALYGDELRTLVEKNDWEGIKNAPSDPPERTKEDLNNKPDAELQEPRQLVVSLTQECYRCRSSAASSGQELAQDQEDAGAVVSFARL